MHNARVRITLPLPPDLLQEIEDLATQKRRPRNEQIIVLLMEALAARFDRPPPVMDEDIPTP